MKFLFLLLFLIPHFGLSKENWQQVDKLGLLTLGQAIGVSISASSKPGVIFAASKGFAIESELTSWVVHKSEDYGFSWHIADQLSFSDNTEYDIFAVKANNQGLVLAAGYVSKNGYEEFALIRRSDDFGVTWKTVLYQPVGDNVVFTSNGSVAIQGNKVVFSTTYEVYRSEDLGLTWQRQPRIEANGCNYVYNLSIDFKSDGELYGIGYCKYNEGIVANTSAVIYESKDFAETWTILHQTETLFGMNPQTGSIQFDRKNNFHATIVGRINGNGLQRGGVRIYSTPDGKIKVSPMEHIGKGEYDFSAMEYAFDEQNTYYFKRDGKGINHLLIQKNSSSVWEDFVLGKDFERYLDIDSDEENIYLTGISRLSQNFPGIQMITSVFNKKTRKFSSKTYAWSPKGNFSWVNSLTKLSSGGLIAVGQAIFGKEDEMAGVVRKSQDQGKNWETVLFQPGPGFIQSAQSNSGDLFVMTESDWIIYRSQDSGKTWIKVSQIECNRLGYAYGDAIISLPDGRLVTSGECYFDDDSMYFAIFESADSGLTWTQSYFRETEQLEEFFGKITLGTDQSIHFSRTKSSSAVLEIWRADATKRPIKWDVHSAVSDDLLTTIFKGIVVESDRFGNLAFFISDEFYSNKLYTLTKNSNEWQILTLPKELSNLEPISKVERIKKIFWGENNRLYLAAWIDNPLNNTSHQTRLFLTDDFGGRWSTVLSLKGTPENSFSRINQVMELNDELLLAGSAAQLSGTDWAIWKSRFDH